MRYLTNNQNPHLCFLPRPSFLPQRIDHVSSCSQAAVCVSGLLLGNLYGHYDSQLLLPSPLAFFLTALHKLLIIFRLWNPAAISLSSTHLVSQPQWLLPSWKLFLFSLGDSVRADFPSTSLFLLCRVLNVGEYQDSTLGSPFFSTHPLLSFSLSPQCFKHQLCIHQVHMHACTGHTLVRTHTYISTSDLIPDLHSWISNGILDILTWTLQI